MTPDLENKHKLKNTELNSHNFQKVYSLDSKKLEGEIHFEKF